MVDHKIPGRSEKTLAAPLKLPAVEDRIPPKPTCSEGIDTSDDHKTIQRIQTPSEGFSQGVLSVKHYWAIRGQNSFLSTRARTNGANPFTYRLCVERN